jgi:ketosteroid isomerase-like protein
VAASDFEHVLEEHHHALGEFVKGDPEPLKSLYSQRDDVTLANPFGPIRRGWKDVAETMERAATLYKEGEVVGFDNLARQVTPELAYVVEFEQFRAKVGGSQEMGTIALRVTTILRPEDGDWKIIHRHADPITSPRTAESVVQK